MFACETELAFDFLFTKLSRKFALINFNNGKNSANSKKKFTGISEMNNYASIDKAVGKNT